MYPHLRAGLCVIAQPCPKISQFIKLIKFMASQVEMVVMCLLAYLVFLKIKYESQIGDKTYDFRSNSTSIKISSIRIFVYM